MGYSFCWIAVQPAAEKALIDRFGLIENEEVSDMPDFRLSSVRLADWYVLQWDREDLLVDSELLRELSKSGRVVALMLEEHVMFCSVEEWRDGGRIWGVVHCSEVDPMHIGVEGSLPEPYAGIHQRHFAEQEADGGATADVDHLIEIPIELAEVVVGYRHDDAEGPFRSMEASASRSGRAKQDPIDGVSTTGGGIDKQASQWYQQHRTEAPSRSGFFSRLFGKRDS